MILSSYFYCQYYIYYIFYYYKGKQAGGASAFFNMTDSNDKDKAEFEGFKWSLKAFKKWVVANHGEANHAKIMAGIHDVVCKTILAAENDLTSNLQQVANYRTNAFELFGFDIFVDNTFNVHVLEVNVSPSLMGSSPLDRNIKGTLVADVFHLVGVYPHDPELIKR